MRVEHPDGFDTHAFLAALDERRRARGLSWTKAAAEMWQLSADLNVRRGDHPISPATITGMPKRRDSSCQHALAMRICQALGRPSADFVHPADW